MGFARDLQPDSPGDARQLPGGSQNPRTRSPPQEGVPGAVDAGLAGFKVPMCDNACHCLNPGDGVEGLFTESWVTRRPGGEPFLSECGDARR